MQEPRIFIEERISFSLFQKTSRNPKGVGSDPRIKENPSIFLKSKSISSSGRLCPLLHSGLMSYIVILSIFVFDRAIIYLLNNERMCNINLKTYQNIWQ